MWKKSRNVRISYSAIPGTSPAHIDDEVTYQSLGSTKIKSVTGVDKPFSVPNTAAPSSAAAGVEAGVEVAAATDKEADEFASMAYNWRGKGWLVIASSKWEILGHGEEEGSEEGNSWVVTYFAKTMFTPAGVDFYSRKGGLRAETVESIKKELVGLGGDVEKLAGELFEVKMDGDRTD